MKNKQQYNKPQIKSLGSVEEITKWTFSGAGEWFGGRASHKTFGSRSKGPADFGS